tara:strand:- start:5243 stop:7621 length:2379 start_codon:yes stop_codon:yes gene_type:complete
MGWWADNVGGGNSFKESVANTFTKGDGASYVGGVLKDDATNAVIDTSGGAYTTSTGDEVTGAMNSTGTTAATTAVIKNTAKGAKKSGSLASGTGTDGIIPGIITWLGGAKNTDPVLNEDTRDPSGQLRVIYTNESNGTLYTMNLLGFPYEVTKNADGQYQDKLSIVVEGDPQNRTGYQIQADKFRQQGDNDSADKVEAEAANNANAGITGDGVAQISEGAIDSAKILEWATEAGVAGNRTDQEAIVADPQAWLDSKGINYSDIVPTIDADAEGTMLDGTDDKYNLEDTDAIEVAVGETTDVAEVGQPTTVTYDAETNADKLTDKTKVNAVTGTIDSDNLVDADGITIDIEAEAEGTGVLGNALNDFATQNISSIIDTSTPEGKLLAQKLGEGNYTDHKATILGQMKIISAEFVDSNGEPRIPTWAQGTLREVQKSIAFGGMSGSAATAAYANAIMESTLGIADKEAAFFQSITVKNLDNRQEGIINKAKILAQFELGNLDARQAAAVQNAKAFLEMDLKNLTNEQQAEVINKEAMVQALFEDSKIINAQRLFTAETQNEMNKYYDNLNAQIQMQNAKEFNAMARFNAGEINDTAEFNADMDDSRDKFYAEMQYNIDVSNAKWRQSVLTTNTKMEFEAASSDVRAKLDISIEAQNRLWDTADSFLDYIFKAFESESDRDMEILKATITGQFNQTQPAKSNKAGDALDTISKVIGVFKALSDKRLKTNIRKIDTLKGINFYQWDWNEEGLRVGADQYPTFGVIAQEVQKTHPEAVVAGIDGYLMVNYGMISNEV